MTEVNYKGLFPFWEELSEKSREEIRKGTQVRSYRRGENISDGTQCRGIMAVGKGRARVYTVSEEGREITLFRLYQYDVCFLSAACVLRGITFDVMIDAEEDTEIVSISAEVYRKLNSTEISVASFTGEIMADKMSEVMWILDQVMNRKMDSRIAGFILSETGYTGEDVLHVTHEQIARELGTAREVVGRLLKYLQKEGAVSYSRGVLTVRDRKMLEEIADA